MRKKKNRPIALLLGVLLIASAVLSGCEGSSGGSEIGAVNNGTGGTDNAGSSGNAGSSDNAGNAGKTDADAGNSKQANDTKPAQTDGDAAPAEGQITDFKQSPVLDTFRWLRVIGDTIFTAGVVALVLFVYGLITGHSTRVPVAIPRVAHPLLSTVVAFPPAVSISFTHPWLVNGDRHTSKRNGWAPLSIRLARGPCSTMVLTSNAAITSPAKMLATTANSV